MPWAAAAAVVAAVIGAGAQSDAARKAGNTQGDAAKKAMNESQRQFDESRADSAPWRQAGTNALADMDTLLGRERTGLSQFQEDPRYKAIYDAEYARVDAAHRQQYGNRTLSDAQGIDPGNYKRVMKDIENKAVQQFTQQYPDAAQSTNRTDPSFGSVGKKFTMQDFQNDPVTQAGFTFGLSEGIKGVNNMAGASGMKNSGQTLKALTQYATDYTGTKANDSYNRFYADQDRVFNRLASQAGLGQTATINTAALGGQNAMNIGNLLTGAANARGAASIAQGNAWGGAASNVGNWYNSNTQLDKYLAARNQPSTTTTTTQPSQYSGAAFSGFDE